MNSRERVLSAMERREPDRGPVDPGATPSSGIPTIAYGNLKTRLGTTGDATSVYDVGQQLAQPEEMMLNRLGVNVVDIGRPFNTVHIILPDVPPENIVAMFEAVAEFGADAP